MLRYSQFACFVQEPGCAIIKTSVQEIGFIQVDWLHLDQQKDRCQYLVNTFWIVEEMLSSWEEVCSMWFGCWFGWLVRPCYRIVSSGMLFCINNKSSGAIGFLEFFTSSTAIGFSAEYGARLVLRRFSCWNTKYWVSPPFVLRSRRCAVYSYSTLEEMYQANHFYTKPPTHLVPKVSAERLTARVECNT